MKDYRIAESMEHMQNYGPNGITNFELISIILGNSEKASKLLHISAAAKDFTLREKVLYAQAFLPIDTRPVSRTSGE